MSEIVLTILMHLVVVVFSTTTLPPKTFESDVFLSVQTTQLDTFIAEAAMSFNVSPFLLKGLLMNESRMNPKMSSRFGRGIASFTPAGVEAVNQVRRKKGVRKKFRWDETMNPRSSIFAAAELLSYLINAYGRDGGVSAYSGGEQHGRYVRRFGYWRAKKKGLLGRSGSIRMSGRYLLNVLKETNLLREAASLPALSPPEQPELAEN